MINEKVNHVASVLHDGPSLPEYSVKCYRLSANPNAHEVEAAWDGPLTYVSVLGFLMTIGLIVLSVVRDDGMALVSTLALSSLSTLIGFGSMWKLELPKRRAKRHVPQSDVVIKYPQGAFVVVKCDEEMARKLYWHPEKCNYVVSVQWYRLMSLIGTLLLMIGVISLSNAQTIQQICFAGSYMILHAAYWFVAALPPHYHWNMNCFHKDEEKYVGGSKNENFTEALWQAIAITRSTDWVRIGNIAPQTKGWDNWLAEAKKEACKNKVQENYATGEIILPDWDCQAALDKYVSPNKVEENGREEARDGSEEHLEK